MAFKIRNNVASERLICDVLKKHGLADVYQKLIADVNFDLSRGAGEKLLSAGGRSEKQFTIMIQGVPGRFWFLFEVTNETSAAGFPVLDFTYIKPPQLPPKSVAERS